MILLACETAFSPRSSPLETYRHKKRLHLSDRNSILMTQTAIVIWSGALIGRRGSYTF